MKYLYVIRHCKTDEVAKYTNYADIADGETLRSIVQTSYTGEEKSESRIVFYNPQRIPFPERECGKDEYMTDVLFWTLLPFIKFRPTEVLTREDCNTIAGRTKLLEWTLSRPFLLQDKNNFKEYEKNGFRFSIESKNKNENKRNPFDESQLTPLQTIEYILRTTGSNQHELFNGQWIINTIRNIPTHDLSLESTATYFSAIHPDMLFANIEGRDILNRDQFREIVSKYAEPVSVSKDLNISLYGIDTDTAITDYTTEQAIDALVDVYDKNQYLIDSLFASYELFRTEQYASIANFSMSIKRTAIRNYLAFFRTFNSKSGDFNIMYPVPYKGSVASNTKKYLKIPDEVFNYAMKKMRVEPLNVPKLDAKKNTDEPNKPRGFFQSKEIRKQRFPVQLHAAFDTNMDVSKRPDGTLIFEGKTIKNVLPDVVLTDVEKHKLFVNLIAAAQDDPSFDIVDIAQKVANCKTESDLDKMTAIPVVINAPDIIRKIWGRVVVLKTVGEGKDQKLILPKRKEKSVVKNENGEETITTEMVEYLPPNSVQGFEKLLRSLPNEPFVHFPLYTKKTRNGTVSVRVTSANIEQYRKKGYAPVGYYGPRFGFVSWKFKENDDNATTDGDKTDEKLKVVCIINVNPLYYSAMADGNGNISNYDYFSDNYRDYTNSIDSDIMQYAYPTELILRRKYDQHFCREDTIVGIERKAAKERNIANGKDATISKEEGILIRQAARKQAQTVTIDKKEFYLQVLESTYKSPDDISNMKKKRIFTYIDKTLRQMVEYGIMLKSYASSADGKSWNFTFLEPKRPSI